MKNKTILIGIVISIACLFLAMRKVEWSGFYLALKEVNYIWVVVAFILSGLSFIPRSIRWWYLLLPVKRTKFSSNFSSMTIGFMANSILPLRAGEVIRAYAISRAEKISGSASFATIVVERVFDLFTLLIFFFLVLGLFPFPELIRKGSFIALAFAILSLAFLLFLKKRGNSAVVSLNSLIGFLPPKWKESINKFLLSFLSGLDILGKKGLILKSIFWSLIVWGIYASVSFSLFKAFGFDLSFYHAYILMVILCLGIMLPSAPGFVGTYHYFAVLGLALLGIEGDPAFSFAVVAHITSFLPVVILGIFSLQRVGMSLWEIRKQTVQS